MSCPAYLHFAGDSWQLSDDGATLNLSAPLSLRAQRLRKKHLTKGMKLTIACLSTCRVVPSATITAANCTCLNETG
jgi:hypothetical protein